MAGFLTGPHYPFDSVNGMGEKSSPRGDEPISGALSECKVPSHRKIDEPLPRIAKYSSLASFGDRYANDSGSHARSVLVHSCSVCGQEFHSFALLSAHISTHVAAANSTAARARAVIDVDCTDSPPVKTPTPSMRCSFCGYATPNAVDFFEHTAAHVDDDGASTNLFMSAQQLRSQSFPVETSPQSLADAVRREAAKYSVQIGVVVDKSPKTLNMPSTSVAYGNQTLKAHVCLTSSSAGTMVEPPPPPSSSSPFSPLTPTSASPTSRVATMVTATTESNAMVPSFVYSPESPSETTTTTTTTTTTESEYVDNKAANTGVNTLAAARRNSATAASAPAGHVCTTCGKSFRLRSYLRIHQRLHTGDLPYSCPVCGKRFNQSWNRNVHMRIHSGIQPYRCKLCSKNFRSAVRLREHLSVVHGTQQNESLDHMQKTSLLRQAAEIGAAKNGYVY
ncbi:replication initiator 1-like isoform X2 [Oscarella lobularis]